MVSPIDTFDRYGFDERAGRWRDLRRGTFVSEETVRAEVARLAEAAQETQRTLTRQLYNGDISLAQWQRGVAAEQKDARLAQSMFARGGRDNMTPREWGRVGRQLRDDYGYLSGFAQDIADGKVSEAEALRRIGMYGNATGSSYWQEWIRQQEGEGWNNLPALTQVPRDGKTDCLTNCKCDLDRRDDGIWWLLRPAEHCDDCKALAAGSPYRMGMA